MDSPRAKRCGEEVEEVEEVEELKDSEATAGVAEGGASPAPTDGEMWAFSEVRRASRMARVSLRSSQP
jgi:hypothetical protein